MNWVEKENDFCNGLYALGQTNTAGKSFYVLVNKAKVEISAENKHILCEFNRVDLEVRLFPWVYSKSLVGIQTVDVELLGIGNLNGVNCNRTYVPW